MSAALPEPRIITFGCRLNAYESEVMRGHARAAALSDAGLGDTVIVNTCAVTAEAERQARVVRSFNLTIALEGGEVFRGDGNVNFLLVRPDTAATWKLRFWRDESEF